MFEAVSERRVLMQIVFIWFYLGFYFLCTTNREEVFSTINLGMWVYDALSLFRSPNFIEISVQQVKHEEPQLQTEGLKGAPLYYDCSTDDARLTPETALDAEQNGAVIRTYIKT